MLIRYQAEDKPGTNNPTSTRGVSGLLQADKTALIPVGNERMARRRPKLTPKGCGGETEPTSTGNGSRKTLPLPVLNGQTASNGSTS